MKLVIFGASGLASREFVRQALDQGHEVTAFLRSSSVLSVEHKALRKVRGEVNEPVHAKDVVKGQGAVLSASETSRLLSKDSGLTQGFKNVVWTMARSGVRRMVYLSAFGAGDSREDGSLVFRSLIIPFVLKHARANHEQNERALQTSSLEWVIVRPSVLTNGVKTELYLAARHLRDHFLLGLVSRADVAHFMLSQLESDQHVRQAVSLRKGRCCKWQSG